MPPILQLRRHGVVAGPDADLARAQQQFHTHHHLHLAQFVEPQLWVQLQSRIAEAPFKLRIARNVRPPAVDLKLADEVLQGSLRWMMSDPALFVAIRKLTGSPRLDSFNGAVYRLAPGQGHHDSWHDDADGHRQVGITVNFSPAPFEGGELDMREAATKRPLWRFANTGPGDAVLFAIDSSLEHCIAPMRGTVAKTALAGWFCAGSAVSPPPADTPRADRG